MPRSFTIPLPGLQTGTVQFKGVTLETGEVRKVCGNDPTVCFLLPVNILGVRDGKLVFAGDTMPDLFERPLAMSETRIVELAENDVFGIGELIYSRVQILEEHAANGHCYIGEEVGSMVRNAGEIEPATVLATTEGHGLVARLIADPDTIVVGGMNDFVLSPGHRDPKQCIYIPLPK